MKPYQQIPIVECGELLVAIPLEEFAVVSPHPYQELGANYGERSPYYLRQSVLTSLQQAQFYLQQKHSGWRIQIFDAYRPLEVQQFMVDYTFAEVVKSKGLNQAQLSELQRQEIWEIVYQFWATPNFNPATPPPHSTGAAIDVTLVETTGETVNMGAQIDEISERSYPNYFADTNDPIEQRYHTHRQLLSTVMHQAGFVQHPNEWWHFSLGDQMWAWLKREQNPSTPVVARYGRCY